MWAYVDESGCLGMKIGAGSSACFTVVICMFDDKSQVIACHDRIEQLKTELQIDREFKFCKCNYEQRAAFFKEVNAFGYSYFGITINKTKIAGFSRPFFHSAVIAACSMHADEIDNATVVIDKTGSNVFRKMMARCLKDDLNRLTARNSIKQVKSIESHKHNLLQLADMVCGAVARSYSPERGWDRTFRDMVRKKEWTITEYP